MLHISFMNPRFGDGDQFGNGEGARLCSYDCLSALCDRLVHANGQGHGDHDYYTWQEDYDSPERVDEGEYLNAAIKPDDNIITLRRLIAKWCGVPCGWSPSGEP